MLKQKMLKIKVLICLLVIASGSAAFAQYGGRGRTGGGGGDMPFPIGRVTDFPSGKITGIWAAQDLKSKLFRLVRDPRSETIVNVDMMNIYKDVVASGMGYIGNDQILAAKLYYKENKDKTVNVKIANYCLDQGFEIQIDKSDCDKAAMIVSLDDTDKKQKPAAAKFYILKRKPGF